MVKHVPETSCVHRCLPPLLPKTALYPGAKYSIRFLSYVDYRTRQPGRAESPQPGREPPSQNFQPPRLNEPGRAERAPQPNPQHSRTRSGPNFGEALFKQQRDSSESVNPPLPSRVQVRTNKWARRQTLFLVLLPVVYVTPKYHLT